MKRTRSIPLLALLAVLSLLAASVTVASAGSSTHRSNRFDAAGTLAYDEPAAPTVTAVGPNVAIHVDITGTIDGTLRGTIHEVYTVWHWGTRGFNTYDGMLYFEGVVVDGDGVEHEGSLTIRTAGRQTPGEPFPTATPWITRWNIQDGDGELENLRGRGTGVINILDMDYTGQLRFARR